MLKRWLRGRRNSSLSFLGIVYYVWGLISSNVDQVSADIGDSMKQFLIAQFDSNNDPSFVKILGTRAVAFRDFQHQVTDPVRVGIHSMFWILEYIHFNLSSARYNDRELLGYGLADIFTVIQQRSNKTLACIDDYFGFPQYKEYSP